MGSTYLLLALCLALVTGINAAKKPNIVFILSDDQSTQLDSLEHMPKLHQYIVREGVHIQNTIATTPVCCPSRASIYTGKYIHNIGVHNNSAGPGGCASLRWQEGPEKDNVAYYMSQLGYATSFAGKYMNNYGMGTDNAIMSLPNCLNVTMARETNDMETTCAQRLEHVPRGWTNWQGLQGNSVYYNYSLSNNGVVEKHGDDYHADYLTDLVKNRSVTFMEEQIAAGNPFFVVASVPAAHEPADPAPQYAGYAEGVIAPRTPNFNMVMDDDARHWMVANVNIDGSPMNDTVINYIDMLYRRRLAALQSVDDLIEEFVQTLEQGGVLENTYVIFTADNGYHLGQFAISIDKRQPYETDLRVPFYARGPGIPSNVNITYGAFLNIDLAPTFLQLAGMNTEAINALGMDGQPMEALLTGELDASSASRQFLIEYNGEHWDACAAYLSNDFGDISFGKLTDGMNCGLRGPTSWKTPPYWGLNTTWSSIQDSSNNTYSCVRQVDHSSDFQYCAWESGEVEAFNVAADEWQMENLAPNLPAEQRLKLVSLLNSLKACSGESCDIPL